MKRYAIGFILGIVTTWFLAGHAAECTAPECNLLTPTNLVDVYKPLPKGSKRRDEELSKQIQYLQERIYLLEVKHQALCNHTYGCDPAP